MALRYVKEKSVRDYVKSTGRRCGLHFLAALDRFIENKIEKACTVKNGGKKTLDFEVAKFVGL